MTLHKMPLLHYSKISGSSIQVGLRDFMPFNINNSITMTARISITKVLRISVKEIRANAH